MNKGQMKGVAEVLKKRFPNLTASETMGIVYDIVEVVLNQTTPDQFPKWSDSTEKLEQIKIILKNSEDGWAALDSIRKLLGEQ